MMMMKFDEVSSVISELLLYTAGAATG